MKFQRIRDWSRRHPATTGGVGFLVAVILIFLAFDSYTRIRLISEIQTLERMGIPCDVAGYAERQRTSGASEALTREFRTLCDAISTQGFPVATRSLRTERLEEEDLPKFLAGHGEELQAADRFLAEHPDLILWRDFSGNSVSGMVVWVA